MTNNFLRESDVNYILKNKIYITFSLTEEVINIYARDNKKLCTSLSGLKNLDATIFVKIMP